MKKSKKYNDDVADVTNVSDEAAIRLQKILKSEGKNFDLEETKKIGQDLIDLYKALARGRRITKGGLKNNKKKA